MPSCVSKLLAIFSSSSLVAFLRHYALTNPHPVNSKSDPVVCRLMNAKVDEYRRKRLAKANSQRKQQKKEIRMKVTRATYCVNSMAQGGQPVEADEHDLCVLASYHS